MRVGIFSILDCFQQVFLGIQAAVEKSYDGLVKVLVKGHGFHGVGA